MTTNEQSDVLIIGGGPSGISASIWCKELGLSSILVDTAPDLGGQLLSIHNSIHNYPGISVMNGTALRDRLLTSIDFERQNIWSNSHVTGFDARSVTAFLLNGSSISAHYAIIATGLRRRKLGISGEDRFVGRGVLFSGARDREFVRGKRVAVIGGGDAALENTLILSQFADKVYLIHRRDRFSARKEFIDRVRQTNNVEIILNACLTAMNGEDMVSQIQLSDLSDKTRSLDVDFVLIRIGYEPNSEIVEGQVETDAQGYIVTDRNGQTNSPNVFAVGDVANAISPTIATAIGTAATAVKSIYSLIRGSL